MRLLKKLLQSALRAGDIATARICVGSPMAPRRPCRSLARGPLLRSRPARRRSPLARSRTLAATAGDHRRRLQRDRQGGLDAADRPVAGGPSLDRRPKRDRHRGPDVARGEPSAADPADMADRRHAGMAGAARRSQDLAAVPRCRLGERAARRSAWHGADLDALKAHILRHTGQVPLFIEEVARQLISRGVLEPTRAGLPPRRRGTPWKFRPPCRGDRVAHRSSVERGQGPSSARIRRRAANLAALLAAVTEHAGRTIAKPPLVAGDSGFPRQSRGGCRPEYEFAHDLIREVAYDSILRAQREELHRRILTAMEAILRGAKKTSRKRFVVMRFRRGTG